jgi:hypothetical protein
MRWGDVAGGSPLVSAHLMRDDCDNRARLLTCGDTPGAREITTFLSRSGIFRYLEKNHDLTTPALCFFYDSRVDP